MFDTERDYETAQLEAQLDDPYYCHKCYFTETPDGWGCPTCLYC